MQDESRTIRKGKPDFAIIEVESLTNASSRPGEGRGEVLYVNVRFSDVLGFRVVAISRTQ